MRYFGNLVTPIHSAAVVHSLLPLLLLHIPPPHQPPPPDFPSSFPPHQSFCRFSPPPFRWPSLCICIGAINPPLFRSFEEEEEEARHRREARSRDAATVMAFSSASPLPPSHEKNERPRESLFCSQSRGETHFPSPSIILPPKSPTLPTEWGVTSCTRYMHGRRSDPTKLMSKIILSFL